MIDHLVYATPDLASTVESLADQLGVRASPGGAHPGRGTRNALLSLGPRTYLEIIGPDPEQPDPPVRRWLGVDALTAPRLTTWAAVGHDLPMRRLDAAAVGVSLGPIREGQRQRADGSLLRWTLTEPTHLLDDGLLPFFIDWGDSPHPAASAAAGLRLRRFYAEHPDAIGVTTRLHALGLTLPVSVASAPALIAELDTPRGMMALR